MLDSAPSRGELDRPQHCRRNPTSIAMVTLLLGGSNHPQTPAWGTKSKYKQVLEMD
jgi:hypothetical protein